MNDEITYHKKRKFSDKEMKLFAKSFIKRDPKTGNKGLFKSFKTSDIILYNDDSFDVVSQKSCVLENNSNKIYTIGPFFHVKFGDNIK